MDMDIRGHDIVHSFLSLRRFNLTISTPRRAKGAVKINILKWKKSL